MGDSKRSNGNQNARPVRALHGWRPPALGHRVREALVAPLAAAELSRLRVIAQTCELRIARDVLAYSYKDFATKSATEIAILPYPLAFILLDAQSAST